jgi:hypothetical protein
MPRDPYIREKFTLEPMFLAFGLEICKEAWLRDDLIVLSSGGVPICGDRSKLSVRPATDEEVVIYKQAAELAKPTDDMVLAFLIELDV